MPSRRPIEEILDEHREEILAVPGVLRVGLDLLHPQGPRIRVEVEYASFEVEERIPPEIDGWTLEIVEVGEQ